MSERFGTVLCDPTKPNPLFRKFNFCLALFKIGFFSYLGPLWVIFQSTVLYYVSKVRLQIF